jgi:hydroxymethylglutaryl-CoA lyase
MKIIECPRDAMQGLKEFIPTTEKVRYLNQLLRVGFDTLDFGSFVSAKAIPQMKDTVAVLDQLDLSNTKTKLLAIVANTRGAQEASSFAQIAYLGFPLSISETFQLRNTNKSIAEALNTLSDIKDICERTNKQLVSYISMGFGNPYNDPYDVSMVSGFADILITLGTDIISVADTVGAASAADIKSVMAALIKENKSREIGVHLHSNPSQAIEKIKAAVDSGCARIDGALKGYGGCPMAKDELVGNIATEVVIGYLNESGREVRIDQAELAKSLTMAAEIFPKH